MRVSPWVEPPHALVAVHDLQQRGAADGAQDDHRVERGQV